jgi:REP element-mobilizing transposase RayT
LLTISSASIEARLKGLLAGIAVQYRFGALVVEAMLGHVHPFASVPPPGFSSAEIVRLFKQAVIIAV